MAGRPRLMHVTTTDVSLEWLLGPQLAAFHGAGYEVLAASAPGPHVSAIEALGATHVPIPSFTRRMSPRDDIRAAGQLAAALRRVRPHILHTHNPKPGVIGRLIGHRMGVPIVVNTVHGLYAQPDDRWAKRTLVHAAERRALRHSDAELVQNEEDIPTLRELGAGRDRVVHLGNGIDLSRFRLDAGTSERGRQLRLALGIAPGTVVVGMVGRLVWEKGFAELIDAIELLDEVGRGSLAFVVIGPREPGKPGALDDESIERMRRSGVHVLDARPDLENVYPAFDLFVLPSHREGYPRAAMEASAMGVPVIASNIRGCRQVVVDGETGRLVPVRRPGALAAAIEELADAPATRTDMGRAARRRAAVEFDDRRVVAITLEVYRRLLRWKGIDGPRPRDGTAVDRSSASAEYADSSAEVDAAASKRADDARAA